MKCHLAKWVLPIAAPPIENGAVVVDNERRIVWCGEAADLENVYHDCEIVEHGLAALLPGLVNAHTHLEFSHLSEPLGQRGMDFPDWIMEVIRHRGTHASVDRSSSIRKGLAESRTAGVVALGEIATDQVCVDDCQGDLHVTLFHERLGSDVSRFSEIVSSAETLLDCQQDSPSALPCLEAAVSPHAPYSVAPQLLEQLLELAVRRDAVVAMHVAESLAEREFVDRRTGPFRELLERLGVWNSDVWSSKQTILQILRLLSTARRSLIVHGNVLAMEELDFIAQCRDRMSIVYCPRTHAWFDHPGYPLEEMLRRGINVALGTDSRASNPDLDLRRDMAFVHQQFPELDEAVVVRMGTLGGAIALGIDDQYGSLEPGKRAAFCVIDLPAAISKSPYAWLSGSFD